MLNSSGESGHPCLLPDLRGNAFSFSSLSLMFAVGYHIWPLLCWGMFLVCPIFWRVLIINECWILSKAFPASIEIIIWFLSFNLLIWCITLIDLCILKNPCISGINPTWSWCMSFLMCLLKSCWGFLHLCSSVILAFSFLFLCCLCLVLVSGWWWPRRMSLEVFLPLQFFETVLEG